MVAIVCVLSVFFVPLGHGPYSTVHGPMTALRSLRNKLQLVLSMWLASLRMFAASLVQQFASPGRYFPNCILDVLFVPPELDSVLRC